MNSYWVPHAGSENHCETRKSLKICYFFNINQEHICREPGSRVGVTTAEIPGPDRRLAPR